MVRLRRSDVSGQGIRRVRSGRGFSYRLPDGSLLEDQEIRARIDGLVIPPAWNEVWITPYANGHIQATGIDTAGRRQYLYHPSWRERQDRNKFDRALALAEALPAARGRVTRDLRLEGYPLARVSAGAFRMLDTGSLRVGGEQYAEANGSHGLSTLEGAHARVSGDTVALKFPAKSGQPWESDIVDADLASLIRSLKRRGPHARLLAWKDGNRWRHLQASQINDYVRAQTNGAFTAKDFRTLHGTVAAAESLAKTGPVRSKTARSKAVAQAMRDAAAVLGNTPAIAKSSYVDPRVVDRYAHGETIPPDGRGSPELALRVLLVGSNDGS
ncbi:DNA topoisomerase IB [Plantibacter sp. VKM Ac-2880]|uniref:DNA topoisomerase IB n=1 Tax=Plantibacter sp. VKM Ac-2880 TaxID=2783827 RepID=UPI0018907B8B|nr:DNA topoisomerase IB [Plantibacter sp. VKM Ac-2880]MBF4568799.1 DNA topoisomerase IB [Plantibacter sp. VKM Ac-2880]